MASITGVVTTGGDGVQDSEAAWTAIRLEPGDNVATALRDLTAGTRPRMAEGAAPVLVEAIARGHKLALEPIAAGDHVLKYGQPIGVATQAIAAGAHVHLHNLEGLAGRDQRKRATS